MKYLKIANNALLCFILSSIPLFSYGQNTESHILDGTEIEYIYPDEGTVVVTFYDGLVKFKWITGPFSGESGRDFIYRARKVSDDEYFLNWHESDSQDFVSLLINFDTKKVYGSALLGYASEDVSIIFDEANIQRVER